jgi:dihydropteroate synthase
VTVRTLVMGVLNVTEDSFSDGGLWLDPQVAVRHGLDLVAAGADLIDVGGESTRPGAVRVDEQVELARVVPVVRELAAAGVLVSVDTMRSRVARAACEAGATVVNDVSGGTADPEILEVAAGAGAVMVLTHTRGPSADMQTRATYGDVVAEVTVELLQRRDAALRAGIASDLVVLDPGIGFAKTSAHNWALLAALPQLVALGHRVLVGASRKSFLGELLQGREPSGRDAGTHAVTALAAREGVWCVRVHDVGPSADAVRVVAAMA